jgi:hypothetical protein
MIDRNTRTVLDHFTYSAFTAFVHLFFAFVSMVAVLDLLMLIMLPVRFHLVVAFSFLVMHMAVNPCINEFNG